MKERLVRLREVRTRVGLGRSTLYQYLADGKFPRPVQIGGGRVAWIESDIDMWIKERIATGTSAPNPADATVQRLATALASKARRSKRLNGSADAETRRRKREGGL
ncbi:AlpA family transcriptional regulator [Caballeronia sp. SEWSISQ10-4 2]|nr:AlpA family transcriptional regulator [Caballeronia sp. SEWSISQ10-4 2]MDN7179040.1 AlpA family transcriptional regulator [Caballeronia sp. SEWSISQ10-4 2]